MYVCVSECELGHAIGCFLLRTRPLTPNLLFGAEAVARPLCDYSQEYIGTTTYNDREVVTTTTTKYRVSFLYPLPSTHHRNGRQARVWLARRIVGLKKVEIGLSSRVSKLADRLASSDDSRSVSAVFGQVSLKQQQVPRARSIRVAVVLVSNPERTQVQDRCTKGTPRIVFAATCTMQYVALRCLSFYRC